MNVHVEPTQYKYSMSIKLSEILGSTLVSTIFPNVEDLVLSSKKFEDYEQAAESASRLVAEVMQSLNAAVKSERFAVLSETNPAISEAPTISKDWGENEMAKVWIVDRNFSKDGPINAVSQTQLIQVHGEEVTLN